MKCSRLLLVCSSILLTFACASLDVKYDYDPGADFTKLKTFGWLPLEPGAQVPELTVKRIQNAVNAQLKAKGLVPTADNPDFLIGIQVSGKTVHGGSVGVGASIGIPVGRGSVSIGGGKSREQEKREGTLVLDFVAPNDRSVLWHGTATGTVHPDAPPEDQDKRINHAVEEMLTHYPPQKQ